MKTILITGSNKGIGFEVARQCAVQGHAVIISGRNESRLTAAAEKLAAGGCMADTLLMDVGDLASITHAAQELSGRKITLDVLVNNAGIIVRGDDSLLEEDDAVFAKTIHVNANGPLRVARAFLPLMNKGAHIINVSSGGGSMTDPVGGWSPAYCVSKSALNAITRHLAYELSAQGVRVNALCPGWVSTDMGGEGAPRTVEQGAETPVWLINDGAGSRTGLFFRDKQEIPW